MKFLKTIGGALATGVMWFFAGFFVGLFGEVYDPHGQIVDIWPAVFAYPAFFSGVGFFLLSRIAGGGRKLHELSNGRAMTLGAISGGVFLPAMFLLLLGLSGELSGPDINDDVPRAASGWLKAAAAVTVTSIGSALAAWATVAYMRKAQPRPIEASQG
jgi:hypothetical protein